MPRAYVKHTEVKGTLAVGGSLTSTNIGFGTSLTEPQSNGSVVVAGNATVTNG